MGQFYTYRTLLWSYRRAFRELSELFTGMARAQAMGWGRLLMLFSGERFIFFPYGKDGFVAENWENREFFEARWPDPQGLTVTSRSIVKTRSKTAPGAYFFNLPKG